MKIVRARVIPIRLALREPLRTARGEIRTREGAVLELSSASGACGWGEALPLAGFGLESTSEATNALAAIARTLVDGEFAGLDAALDGVEESATTAKAARAAADAALHDLAAREAGVSVASLLSTAPQRQIPVNALVEGAAPTALAASARAAVARGHHTLKLKLLGGALDHDLARVAAVRSAIGDGPKLRLDANGGWQVDRAIAAVERLAGFGIELLEQPVAADDIAGLARVREASQVAIAADEAVRDPAAAARILATHAADVLVLKPAALGGLRAAHRIAREAERAGVAVFVTSFLDSSLGIAAALQLAAALPPSPHAAGLATAELLAQDLAPPLTLENGEIPLPESPGIGLAPDPASLVRSASAPAFEVRA